MEASSGPAVSEWSKRVDQLEAAGQLVVRLTREDTMIPGRRHERLAQRHRGVPVFGGELVRQSDAAGALTVFGTFYEGIDVDVTPRLGPAEVEGLLAAKGGRPFGRQGGPELVVLPLDSGGYRLAYRARALFPAGFDVRQTFFDAGTGEVLLDYRDIQTQAAGLGTGVLGDPEKLSVSPGGLGFTTADRLRPPLISTYDFRFNVNRLILFFDADASPSNLTPSDLGTSADNVWTDGAIVDAHVFAGFTYDYYYKRFGRQGLDNANIPVHGITHALRREDWRLYTTDVVLSYFTNAFYVGEGVMYYGDGLPPTVTLDGQHVNYLAGALDVVAHELTHGVTDYSSRLTYQGESGALNESFSDVMATGVEFDFQPTKADYLMGEDVFSPGGIRSLANPMAFGDPDYYPERYTGSADNGGVHTNSGISSNAYYLAIEGGRHRLGATVQGVGAAHRDQIEKVFYRAFTAFLVPSATFSQARAATIQAARELYGAGSPAETAVTQAWTAVGVN
ncbi:MAG TPA: M4 family metallopeptidase [Vicinamibacteria bacterium]|nr:M4 family metallopeptidase [Vicinamibacteria bacterium]